MIHTCQFCSEDIEDGDEVSLLVYTKYRRLGSRIAFALNTSEMIADPTTLAHKDCKGKINGF